MRQCGNQYREHMAEAVPIAISCDGDNAPGRDDNHRGFWRAAIDKRAG